MKGKSWEVILYGYTAFMAGACIVNAFYKVMANDAAHTLSFTLLFAFWILLSTVNARELAEE